MTDNVIRIADYERKSKSPNAARPRDPATIIVLPSGPTADWHLRQDDVIGYDWHRHCAER